MRIERAELMEVRLPLRAPFEAAGRVRRERRILLLRLEGETSVGWGECVAPEEPGYTYETTETAWHILTDFILPRMPGLAVDEPREVLAPCRWIRGHPMAKAAVEMAAWDLSAKGQGRPLAEQLGGEVRWLPTGVAVGSGPPDEVLETVERHVARGYRQIKLKIAPGADVDLVRRATERLGDGARLLVDANGAYGRQDFGRLKGLDDLGLLMIEQPLAPKDFRGHGELQAMLDTPICLDESVCSVADLLLAFDLRACRVVNLKPGRVGGFGPALRIHDLCRSEDVALRCGGMLESGVGRAQSLALATLPGFTFPGDLSESARYWERDLVRPVFELEEGGLRVPAGPGMGVEPDLDFIEELEVRRATFE